ncbi:MAG TPA: Rpp14/Pop5 family protein [Methanoregulaceae archaeon]|nr:Rpp14/Pop5 family protein [Methanoregulaceae archaeon]
MKPRPPTMRDKRRYVLVRIDPPFLEIDSRDLYLAILDSFTSLFGDQHASEAQMAVVDCRNGHAIVRCIRGQEGLVEKALITVNTVNAQRVALRTRATSGTMHSLKMRIIRQPYPGATEERKAIFAGNLCVANHYQGQKVDVFAKGFKNQELLFLTHRDLEE